MKIEECPSQHGLLPSLSLSLSLSLSQPRTDHNYVSDITTAWPLLRDSPFESGLYSRYYSLYAYRGFNCVAQGSRATRLWYHYIAIYTTSLTLTVSLEHLHRNNNFNPQRHHLRKSCSRLIITYNRERLSRFHCLCDDLITFHHTQSLEFQDQSLAPIRFRRSIRALSMDSQAPTPSPSSGAKSQTPASIDYVSGKVHMTSKERLAAFKSLQNNERSAIKKIVDRFIQKNSKASIMSAEDRMAMLIKKRDDKVQERVDCNKGSIKSRFPDFYDEMIEKAWLSHYCRLYLDGHGAQGRGSGCDADQDDDEPKPRIKQEITDHLWEGNLESVAVKYGRRCKSRMDYEENNDEEDEEDGDNGSRKRNKPVVGLACPRGDAIRFGCVGVTRLKAMTQPGPIASKAGIVVRVAVTPGFMKPETCSKKRAREDDQSKHPKRVKA